MNDYVGTLVDLICFSEVSSCLSRDSSSLLLNGPRSSPMRFLHKHHEQWKPRWVAQCRLYICSKLSTFGFFEELHNGLLIWGTPADCSIPTLIREKNKLIHTHLSFKLLLNIHWIWRCSWTQNAYWRCFYHTHTAVTN